MKPLTFKQWLKLIGKERIYPRAHPMLKGKIHRRYEKYLDGWEREVGRDGK